MARTKKRRREDASESDESEIVDLTEEAAAAETSGPKPKKQKKNVLDGGGEIPFVLAASAGKEGRSSLLLELATVDLKHDTGAIGRANVKEDSLRVDLKGLEHDAALLACPAILLVSIGAEEAKIEAVVSEYADISKTADGMRLMTGGQLDDSYRHFHNDIDVNKIKEPSKKKKRTALKKRPVAPKPKKKK